MFEYLFHPMKVNGLEIKNRIIMPAMHTEFTEYNGGFITDKHLNYYAARAKGGVGMIITEAMSVYGPTAMCTFVNASDDKFLPGMTALAKTIKENGARACCQLLENSWQIVRTDPDKTPTIPSDYEVYDDIHHVGGVFKASSEERILDVIEAYGRAAARAVKAGYDAIELHGAHGYLPHTFLSAAMNKRTDKWGGSLENRARFMLEVIKKIRANIPADMPLFLRIVAHDDGIEDGLSLEDIIQVCKWAKELGVDVLDITRGGIGDAGSRYQIAPIDAPSGFNNECQARIRREVGLPVLSVGRHNDPEKVNKAIADGMFDFAGLGRQLIGDPEWPNKSKEGRVDDIIKCIGCNQGCVGKIGMELPMECLRNPAVSREGEFELKPAPNPKRVMIIGGGMAGMECAITLQQRGNIPVLFEKTDKLGGQMLLAGMGPRKDEFTEAAKSRAHQLEKEGVEVRYNTEVTVSTVKNFNPDNLVIAVGASPLVPNIKGYELPNVYEYKKVLEKEVELKGKVVVIGGGLVGLETAEAIVEAGCDVTIVEQMKGIGNGMDYFRLAFIMPNMIAHDVKMLDETKALEFTDHSVIVESKDGVKEIEADAIVIAVGAKSNPYQDIMDYAKSRQLKTYVIGDAVKPRRALDAIYEGALVGRKI